MKAPRPRICGAIEEITIKARDDKGAKIMLGRWLESQKGRVVGDLRLDGERDTTPRR